MKNDFGYEMDYVKVALRFDDYYVWDSGAIKDKNGIYHLFNSRWEAKFGFGWNWLFNSRIIHSTSTDPMKGFTFKDTTLPRRGNKYFDGMNTHNTCIKEYNGKYYLYYMGTTYDGDPIEVPNGMYDSAKTLDIWNHKRIGVAVADSLDSEFRRFDAPLLDAREGKWDQTAITNPAVIIMDDGTTYLMYKSRYDEHSEMQLGLCKGPTPLGPFERVSDDPIHLLDDPNIQVEDPFFWYDKKRKKFCLIAKDCAEDEKHLITGSWGAGFYAESDDGVNYRLGENPLVYTREVLWEDGHESIQGNLERPCVIFDDDGNPTHIFFASGDGLPYNFVGPTYCLVMKLKKCE